jgi:pimeloyl-ACP methyl ester carboxylesterase
VIALRRWLLRGFKAVAFTLATLIVLLPLALWLDHRFETAMPTLTGTYAVARTTSLWEDAGQSDSFAPAANTPRRLIAWIWYPVNADAGTSFQDYFPRDWLAATEQQRGVLISSFFTRDLSRIRSRSVAHGEIVSSSAGLPVVIMRAGLAAQTLQYATLAEDLASHGYVVVGFDAPYRTAVVVMPDGAVIERTPANNVETLPVEKQDDLIYRLQSGWVSDIGFSLDRLRSLNESDTNPFGHKLDLDHVGVIGHSLGGASAAQFCHDDSRCKAGVDIDGALRGTATREGISQSFLFLLAEHGEDGSGSSAVKSDIRGVRARNPIGIDVVELHRASHFGFSDDGALLKTPGLRRVLSSVGLGGMDGERQLALTKLMAHTFFDVHLKGEPAQMLVSAYAQPDAGNASWAR